MADGDDRLVSGQSWSEFCDTLKTAGNVILSERVPGDALTRAEGFRFLSRVTRAALEAFVEYADPKAPVLFRPVHETVKMGADNPDNYYQWACISGEHEYVIRGQRGTVRHLTLSTYTGTYGTGGRSGQTGQLDVTDLDLNEDGSFEVRLSCQEQPGNWLPMEPDTSSLIVRQTHHDRHTEEVAELLIHRLDGDGMPSTLTPEALDEGLTKASRLVMGSAMMFGSWAQGFMEHANELPRFDPATSLAAHGDPNIAYYHSYWRLAPDEALVIEATPPECEYWNFQLNNFWMESLDYRYHRIAINDHEATLEPDGSLRIVVAHQDPGQPNWLTTAGHEQGTMCFRWTRAEDNPTPVTRVVKLDELRKG